MSLANALYAKMPTPLQAVAVTAVGMGVRWMREGGEFRALLAQAEAADLAAPEELGAIREHLWSTRMRAAVSEVEAYGRRTLSLDDVRQLPVLTKAAVRQRVASFIRHGYPRWRTIRMHTSGTTGAGLQFFTTLFAARRLYAHVWRYWGWHGIHVGEPCGVFAGRPVIAPARREPPFWIADLAGRTVHFSQYHLTPERVRLYLEEIRRRGLRWLHGYPSVLGLLARLGIEAGLEGHTDVKWVTLSSENVLESHRRDIVRMFGVQPRQHYGMGEDVALICECPFGALHVDEAYSLVEFVPLDDVPGAFRLVGTSLSNEVFPLLRYEVRDVMRLREPGTCPCGRSGRIVQSIDGREEEFLVLSDGARVGRTDGFFKDAVRVAEAQFVQRRAGAVNLRIVRANGYSESDEAAILATIRERVGDRLSVAFEYVSELPRTRSGKLRLVVSELDCARQASSRDA